MEWRWRGKAGLEVECDQVSSICASVRGISLCCVFVCCVPILLFVWLFVYSTLLSPHLRTADPSYSRSLLHTHRAMPVASPPRRLTSTTCSSSSALLSL